MKSIIHDLEIPRCYACGSPNNLELHHIMHGTANRRLSTRYGLVCYLCRMHHTGQCGVHSGNIRLDKELKAVAQSRFEEIHGHKMWMDIFRKNYL